MRVRDATTLVSPRQLSSEAYLADPYPLVGILRENYPCYRDWPGNCFWVTRYDDVTSTFTDDANFEKRGRGHLSGIGGHDLWSEVSIQQAIATRADNACPSILQALLDELETSIRAEGSANLAVQFCARLPVELMAVVLGLAPTEDFVRSFVMMRRAWGWEPNARAQGLQALEHLAGLISARMSDGTLADGSLLQVAAALGADARDVLRTLVEIDVDTLHGSLANLWCALLSDADSLAMVRADRRLVKASWLEALRHSAPVVSTDVFARHEVERFGRLLPEGALLRLSSAAANRDPRVFDDPDRFLVERKDLTQREARGQFRADGLPSAISFGTGRPSKFPAVPEDRPRSPFAQVRDHAVLATNAILDRFPTLRLIADSAPPSLRSLRFGEPHTCWSLPVTV